MRRTAIDLFCGAGGLSEGFRQAGFHVLAGNDIDEAAGRTYAATHPEAVFLGGAIQDIAPEMLLDAAGLKVGELDVLIGGPPCQAYSVYNHQRGLHDDRANLFREYLRLVEGLQPKWVVMENVTGIISIANGSIVDTIKAKFGELGYRVEHMVLKAEDFGVPQERRRIFFIGTRTDAEIQFPAPTHGQYGTPFTTVWDAIGDLPFVENGEDPGVTSYAASPKGWYQHYVRGNAVELHNHSAPKLGQVNLDRLRHIPEGGSWRDIPFDMLPAGMKKAKRSDHTKRYGRMRRHGLSCTVLTKCDIHWGAYIHPIQNRAITVREAARLQSFPDWFKFVGSKTEQYVQVGNAVPPLLGRNVAEAIVRASEIRHGASPGELEGSVAA
ncbi:MAG: DNA cytosine methyltransferase [Minwuia sp.]|uniref:DNA cytosine methyltransferase n=1 Tax=Minwuia sp. TaxID=2493630 RepID=UPI003A85C479